MITTHGMEQKKGTPTIMGMVIIGMCWLRVLIIWITIMMVTWKTYYMSSSIGGMVYWTLQKCIMILMVMESSI